MAYSSHLVKDRTLVKGLRKGEMQTHSRRICRVTVHRRVARPLTAALTTLVCFLGSGLLAVTGHVALAADVEDAGRTSYGVPSKRCEIDDDRLSNITGYTEVDGRRFAVNAGTPATAYLLNNSCAVAEAITLKEPVADIQDIVAAADGRLWLADVGGTPKPRATVTLLRWSGFDPGSKRFDLSYPDGAHDAQALLVSFTGSITVVTAAVDGRSGVYTTQLPLADNATLTKMGEIDLGVLRAGDDTSPASLVITGGAVSPDGTHVALRTATAGYEWYTPDADIGATVTGDKPRVVSLTTQSGKAISYSENGDSLIAVSSGLPAAVESIQITRNRDTASGAAGSTKLTTRVAVGVVGILALIAVVSVVAWRLRKSAAVATTYQGSRR